ncbi:hypothetical protein BGZ61DRAFT_461438 [Ilyonectria robusta]|uniref:uncharacterized protein n=1 Tax=Ilyonectria robusta TaxID=1079257 RepID=UPI001E8CE72F|nr:uncharacterized protein BGZ61DRAFT_461438 [Ilyonectria robusta]KAH8667250.1 hypothetical protein BGZ61DRAFT_461438 [Ilyonectria robusta]
MMVSMRPRVVVIIAAVSPSVGPCCASGRVVIHLGVVFPALRRFALDSCRVASRLAQNIRPLFALSDLDFSELSRG